MRICYALGHFFFCEIFSLCTKRKNISSDINRIGSVIHRSAQYFKTACGNKQFRLSHIAPMRKILPMNALTLKSSDVRSSQSFSATKIVPALDFAADVVMS